MSVKITTALDPVTECSIIANSVLPDNQYLTVEYDPESLIYTFCLTTDSIKDIRLLCDYTEFHSERLSRAKARGLKKVLKRISVTSEEVEDDGKTYLMVEL